MFGQLLNFAVRGIAASKVEPSMVLTATRDIFITLMDRGGQEHSTLFAAEGDSIRVEGEDTHRGDDMFVCTNMDNHDEMASIPATDLDDVFMEYT